MVQWEAVNRNVTNFVKAQRKRVAKLERRVKISEGQQAVLKTAPRKSKSQKKEERENGNEKSGGASSREKRRPKVDIRKEIRSAGAA